MVRGTSLFGGSLMVVMAMAALALVQAATPIVPRWRPYVIGHRGASGALPDHTLEGYRLAIDWGADFIECDVVLTKDLVPICRHEPLLSGTTNADQVFPEHITSYVVDGYNTTGVFSVDLTLAQVKMLRAKQPLPERNQSYNGMYQVPTLHEYIQVAKHYNPSRVIGIYPETKHPTWHDSLPFVKAAKTSISDIVLDMLNVHGYKGPLNSKAWAARPAFIQSFETQNLKYLAKKTCIPLIQLMDSPTAAVAGSPNTTYGDLMTDGAMANIAQYASGVGPWKNTLIQPNPNLNNSGVNGAGYVSSGLLERIHRYGMQAHPYTWRNEAYRLAYANFTSPESEYDYYFSGLGIDGAFTDFSITLRTWMDSLKVTQPGRRWYIDRLNAEHKPKWYNPKC